MKENCPSNAGLLDYGFPGEWWFRGFRLANCIKPGLFCFCCPKISQSKAAWYRLWRSDVCVLNAPSGGIKTCAAVRGSTTLCYGQAD